jgi:hypothetical protein
MSLEEAMLNGISQKQKEKYFMLSFIYEIFKNANIQRYRTKQ